MNKKGNSTSYIRKFMRFFALVMIFVLVIGCVPGYAASKKSITAKTIKSLKKAMENEDVKTITFKYSKKKNITIPELPGSADKKLIISAPKAYIVNRAKFSAISIDSTSYKEEGNGNILTVKASSKIKISEDVTVKKIVLKGKSADVVLGAGCEVESLECRKTAADVSLSVGKDVITSIILAKKTKIMVAGDTLRKLSITSKAKGCTVTTYVPVDIFASKDISIVFEKGSEGSSVNATSNKVRVKITDNSDKTPVFMVAGKEVKESVATPTPSITPSPVATVSTEIITSPISSTSTVVNSETGTSPSGTDSAVYPVYTELSDTGNGNTGSYAGGTGSSNDVGGIVTEMVNDNASELIPDEDYNISGVEIGNTPADSSEVKKDIHIGDNYSSEKRYKPDGMVRSYLFKEEGDLCILETQYGEPGLVFIERFDPSWELKESITLTYDPSLQWGGFYCGEKYNFIIVGQANHEEDVNKMVIRTIKYDKKWNEIGSVDLNGANTYCPFASGSLRCAEKDGYLYVLTCHQQYKDTLGVNHQSNMMFSVNEEEMTMPYTGYIYQFGYVSHSFDQYILVNDKGQLVTVDLGDGCPRAIQFCILDIEDGVVVRQDEKIAFPFEGKVGDNATGANTGGIEETSKGYVLAFNHEDSNGLQDMPRNIYIEFASKYATENPTEFSGTRICYSPNGNIRTTTPIMVSLGIDEGGYVFWEEYDADKDSRSDEEKRVCYIKYDNEGAFSDIYTFKGSLSDCKPILIDGIIYWYVSGKITFMDGDYDFEKDVPTFYSLNTETGEISIQHYGEQALIVDTDIVQRETRHYVIANSFHNYFPLYDEDVFDDNGVLVETDYYNIRSELSAKKTYEYDETGKLACERYTIPDNENGDMVFAYYSDNGVESTKYAELYEEDLYYHTDTYYENGAPKSKAVTQYSVDIDGNNIEHIEKVEWDEAGYRAKYSIHQQKDGVYDVTESWIYYESGKLRVHSREEQYLSGKKKHSLTEEYYTEDGQLERSVNWEESESDNSKKAYDELGRVIHEDYVSEFYSVSVDYTYNEDGSYHTRTETDSGTWWENYYDVDGTLIKTVTTD